MSRIKFQFSFFSPVLLFWIFLSLPRIWFLWGGEASSQENWQAIALTLASGFLRDGLVVGIFLFIFQLTYKWLFGLPKILRELLASFFILFFSLLLVAMMMDVEFIRYFGSHSNFTHLRMVFDSNEGLTPFMEGLKRPGKIYISVLLTPALFIVAALLVRSWRVDWFLRSRAGFYSVAFFIIVGLFAAMVPIHNSILFNLRENYVVNFIKNLVVGDEITGYKGPPIREGLDVMPLENPRGGSNYWMFVDPNYPLVKATDHQMCVLGLLDKATCDKDEDHDGVPLKDDCNDHNAAIHPGAFDIPGNGIDEDCSGLDANPPNVIFIHWEGVRAVNVGSIGYAEPATPEFDRLVKKGVLFRNAYANGTQTRWSLTSVYNSILPRLSTKWIFKHNPELNIEAYPEILRSFGYQTFYVHSGDIGFSNFTSRFWAWFEVMYDRNKPPLSLLPRLGWGPRDGDLFDACYKIIKDRKDPRPFYMTIATLSLHYPYKLPDPKFEFHDHRRWQYKLTNIIRYSDAMMGHFIEQILNDKSLQNTIIIVAADHGMNMFAPHHTDVQNELWEDLTWVPIALFGKNWGIPPGVDDEIRQLADIGPTILDRLGIEVPNHFIGHSLLKKFGKREPRALFGNANGGLTAGLRFGKYKYWVHIDTDREYLFDLEKDRQEIHNLINDPGNRALADHLKTMVLSVYNQNTKLIQKNRIWDWKYWIGPPRKAVAPK